LSAPSICTPSRRSVRCSVRCSCSTSPRRRLIGIESPGLTASEAIAELVDRIVSG
jgi:hypothetical protein